MFFDDSAVKSTGKINGGVKRDRTADLLNAIQALSQLSYNPKRFGILSFYGLHFFESRFYKINF